MLILTNCNFLGAETRGAIKSDLTPKLERNLDPQPNPNNFQSFQKNNFTQEQLSITRDFLRMFLKQAINTKIHCMLTTPTHPWQDQEIFPSEEHSEGWRFFAGVSVPQALVGERGVISSTICATVLQWEDAKMESFVGFPGLVGPSSHFLLVENIAFNYSSFTQQFKSVYI